MQWFINPSSPPIRVHSPTACVPLRAGSGFRRTAREQGGLAKMTGGCCPHQAGRETGLDHTGVGTRTSLASSSVVLPCGARVAFRRANLVLVGGAMLGIESLCLRHCGERCMLTRRSFNQILSAGLSFGSL